MAAPVESPLGFMQSLNSTTLYFDPDVPHRANDPKLVLLLTWMDARDAHIAKYITQHRALFPSSRIVLLRITLPLFIRTTQRRAAIAPSIPIIESAVEGSSSDAQILVHIFSNGGMATAVTLFESLPSVPRHVTLLDSCPGYFDWMRNHYAIAHSLPGWMSPFIHLLIATSWVVYIARGCAPPQDSNAAAMNSRETLKSEVRRTYLYGTGDEAVVWTDVERHAAEAKTVLGKEDENKVRMEKFEGGKHAAHIRVDGERYWKAVKETWEGI